MTQPVALDYFLFSCFEHEHLLKANPGSFENAFCPHVESYSTLEDGLDGIIAWYIENYPSLKDSLIHLETLPDNAHATVLLRLDLDKLIKKVSGEAPPRLQRGASELPEQWQKIAAAIEKHLDGTASYITKFYQLCYGPEEETFEPGSRPPVGKYAPRLPRTGGRDSKPGGRSGPRDSKGRGDRGGRGGPRDARGRGDRSERGGPRDNKGRGDRGGRGRDRGPRREGRFNDDDRSAHLEERALKDVLKAVRELKSDSNKDAVTLPPANSFYRRLQHNHVKETGYNSHSVGEGRDRAVVITRGSSD